MLDKNLLRPVQHQGIVGPAWLMMRSPLALSVSGRHAYALFAQRQPQRMVCCVFADVCVLFAMCSCGLLQPDGLLGQLHAGNLLGTLQVVIEAAVADVTRMIQRQTDANQRVSGVCLVVSCWGCCVRQQSLVDATTW